MRIYCFYILILIIPFACSSPQKSFDKGNYEKAYKGALKEFKKGKRSRKAKTLMNKSFEELIKEKSNEAEKYLASDVIEDWEVAYREYDDLLDLYYDGKAYLDQSYVNRMQKMEDSTNELQSDIALNYHDLGQMSMHEYEDTYSKLAAQDAFRYFEKTKAYDADFEDIDMKLRDAYDKAVVVMLVEADAPFEVSYSWEIDQRFSDIENESRDFYLLRYERNLTSVDCVMEIDFASLDVSRRESSNSETFSREIEDGYDTKVDTSGNTTRIPRYRTIRGTVTTIAENLNYRWRVAVNIQGDREYCDFDNRYFDAEELIVNERYELSGDREAIPDRYKQRPDNRTVREDDVAEELIDELYRDIVRYYFGR